MRIRPLALILACAVAACGDASSAPTLAPSDHEARQNGLILGSGNRTDTTTTQSGQTTSAEAGVGLGSGG